MPEPTPAEELRTAAATLREWSAAADADSPAPWYIRVHGRYHLMRYGPYPGSDLLRGGSFGTRGQPRYMHGPVARWIALLDPGMGPLLADWLDEAERASDATVLAAGRVWPLPCDESEAFIQEQAPRTALAVARKINAKEQP